MAIQQMIAKLNQFKTLSPDFREYILKNADCSTYQRGESISLRPRGSKLFFYIVSGTVCGINTHENKKTVLWFSEGNHFIIPTYNRSGRQYLTSIEFITQSQLIPIDFSSILEAANSFKEASMVFTQVIAENLSEANERELLLRLPNAERYEATIKKFPCLLTECSAQTMTSQLSVSSSTFSRIKKDDLRTGS